MPADSKFSLLQLPCKVILRTIRLMDIAEILVLSLTSKKCKQTVIDAKTKADFLDVIIRNPVTLIIESSKMKTRLAFFIHDKQFIPGQKKSLRAPSSVSITSYNLEVPLTLMLDHLDFNYFLDHIQSIFHLPETIDYVQFEHTFSQFDLKKIKNVFGKIDELDVEHTGCYAYNQLILQEFLPVKHFSVNTGVFQDSKIPANILIQHFETFIVECSIDGIETMELNDLLLMNSKQIQIYGYEISPKKFNKFLKLWIKGAMPQLEYLSIGFSNDKAEENEVMKGIKYQKFPSKRVLRKSGGKQEYTIEDGMDFYGKNGLKAVVQINHTVQNNLDNNFEFFVFHDYFSVASQLENK